ncbi:hypothetical protein [Moorena producens]|uniref:hypothetical protein n=1 Tax=Moorena producens TaxID=1155739 RepID=UPI001314CDDF|nr:hypothetical protein [Moorena producens]
MQSRYGENSREATASLLPFAYCLLPIAFCLLPIAFCLKRISNIPQRLLRIAISNGD